MLQTEARLSTRALARPRAAAITPRARPPSPASLPLDARPETPPIGDRQAAGLPGAAPPTFVQMSIPSLDVGASRDFYARVLGFQVLEESRFAGGLWVTLGLQDIPQIAFVLEPHGTDEPFSPLVLHLELKNLKRLSGQLAPNTDDASHDDFFSHQLRLRDPSGHILHLSESV